MGEDEVDLADPSGGERRSSAARRPGSWRGSAWPWAGVAVALVVTGVVVAPTPRSTVNVVDDVAGPPSLAWEIEVPFTPPLDDTPIDLAVPAERVALLGDVAVVATADLVAGYALADGAELWSRTAEGDRCALTDPVVCAVGVGAETRVVTIDLERGVVQDLAVPDAVAAAAVEGDLLVATSGTERALQRIGDDGTVRWRTVADDRPAVPGRPDLVSLAVTGDRLVVKTGAGGIVVDAGSGEVLQRPTRVTVAPWGVHTSGRDGAWWSLPGGVEVAQPRDTIGVQVDDDPAGPQHVALTSSGPALLDARGEPIAELGGEPLARLEGLVIVAAGADRMLQRFDARTGEELEPIGVPVLVACPCLGSGSTLVGVGLGEDGGIGAVDVVTGEALWEVDRQVFFISPVALSQDGVLVLTDGTLTFLAF